MDDSYRLRLQKRAELQQRVTKIMADDRLDAIVYPYQQRLVPIGETQVERNGALGAVTGFPAIGVPGGFSSPTPTATLGVPVGIEFLGRPWSEHVLIEIACGYEQATKHRRPPPMPCHPASPTHGSVVIFCPMSASPPAIVVPQS